MSHRKASPVRNDAAGMRGERSRNLDGALRQKRGDTHASTVEEMYHVDLRVRGDKKLSNVLRENAVDSLNDLLEKVRGS